MAENSENKKIVGFKKFTDIKGKPKVEEIDPSLSIDPETDSDIPMNPNLPNDSKKRERIASRKNLIPKDQTILSSESDSKDDESEETNEGKVETIGKVARFPKGVKASKAYNFMENVKISKKSIWYIMVEKEQELQVVKYNYKEGVDLNKFVNELKSYYISKYKGNRVMCESISKISVDGNDKYSMIKGIPLIEIDGKKIITKITEDLIKLLSK